MLYIPNYYKHIQTYRTMFHQIPAALIHVKGNKHKIKGMKTFVLLFVFVLFLAHKQHLQCLTLSAACKFKDHLYISLYDLGFML